MRAYVAVTLALGVAAALGVYHSQEHGPAWLGVAGALGLGAGACLLLIAPRSRAIARRFAAAKQFTLAHRLFGIADRIAPDASVSEEDSLRPQFDRIDVSTARAVPLPPGWDGRELAMSRNDRAALAAASTSG